ncbi:hypothetical protein [Serratia fonticola]|uniref:hypothetical protein n=1 Tax=Serratia fonticola TaxID=47917 RepID=UPI0016480BDA|nr:hypothetical protein [Serratia fonticola]MBC3230768.1 hypothetical protein [Serratia fonticola]
MKYCLIQDGNVINVVIWDGITPVDFGDVEVLEVNDETYVGPGFTFDGVNFLAPPPPEEESA